MNKIYSLKYSHITGGLVAVSELTRKVSVGTSRKKVILGIILSSIYLVIRIKDFLSAFLQRYCFF